MHQVSLISFTISIEWDGVQLNCTSKFAEQTFVVSFDKTKADNTICHLSKEKKSRACLISQLPVGLLLETMWLLVFWFVPSNCFTSNLNACFERANVQCAVN